jgi:putative transposase
MKTGELTRKHEISDATLCNWKAKFGGMDVSDAKRFRTLVKENSQLKRLQIHAMLDNSVLNDSLSKKMLKPATKREAVVHL